MGTILNDDPPSVSLAITSAHFSASGGTDTITATLSNTWSSDVVVYLAFNGTAISGANYTYSASTITIPAGQTSGSAIHRPEQRDRRVGGDSHR